VGVGLCSKLLLYYVSEAVGLNQNNDSKGVTSFPYRPLHRIDCTLTPQDYDKDAKSYVLCLDGRLTGHVHIPSAETRASREQKTGAFAWPVEPSLPMELIGSCYPHHTIAILTCSPCHATVPRASTEASSRSKVFVGTQVSCSRSCVTARPAREWKLLRLAAPSHRPDCL